MIENPNRNAQAKLFKDLALQFIHRRGISDLLTFLEETDFFIAPASTKYHGAYIGGLLDHSLEVHCQMMKLANLYNYETGKEDNQESLAIVSLFHDVCKINNYVLDTKKVKNEVTGEWSTQSYWKFDEAHNKFGAHGAQSLYYLQNFIKLKEEEAQAIYHHMGCWDMSKYDNISVVYENNKLAWLLHVADEAATFIADI